MADSLPIFARNDGPIRVSGEIVGYGRSVGAFDHDTGRCGRRYARGCRELVSKEYREYDAARREPVVGASGEWVPGDPGGNELPDRPIGAGTERVPGGHMG